MALVYALVSSEDQTLVRYIGRTKANSPDKRLNTHKRTAKSGGTYHVHNWIRKVESSGDIVIAITLEDDLSWGHSGEREIYWIAYYKNLGVDLTNMTSGGDGAPDLSEESRQVMSLKRRGKGHSQTEETRRKISNTRKERNIVPSDEVREKYKNAKLGKSRSEATKAKISQSMTGKKKSDATKEKMSQWQVGRILSDTHKEKVRKTLKKYYSEESDRLPGGRKRK